MWNFLKPNNVLTVSRRTMAVRGYKWNDEGVQCFGFKYYPRHKDFKDPPYDPSKLFRVQRIKPLKGVPFYERKILEEFKLAEKQSDVAVVKNIPENNQRLWKIKHLVKIVPITFPDGFPSDASGTYLKENGELRVKNVFDSSEDNKLQLTEDFEKKENRLDGHTLRRQLRQKWLSAWN